MFVNNKDQEQQHETLF